MTPIRAGKLHVMASFHSNELCGLPGTLEVNVQGHHGGDHQDGHHGGHDGHRDNDHHGNGHQDGYHGGDHTV